MYACVNCGEIIGEELAYFCTGSCQNEWEATHVDGEPLVAIKVDKDNKKGSFVGLVPF